MSKGLAHLGHLLQGREQILHAADLLLVDENEGIIQGDHHLLRIGHEIGGEVAAVELHPFHHVEGGLHGLGFFHGDDPFLAHLVHGFGNDVPDGLIVVGGDGADLGDFPLILGGFADGFEFLDDRFDCQCRCRV